MSKKCINRIKLSMVYSMTVDISGNPRGVRLMAGGYGGEHG